MSNTNTHAMVHDDATLCLSQQEMPTLEANEVLVKVAYSGLCGSDLPRVLSNGAHFYPITLGHEFSGEVVQLGNQVNKLQTGDKIACAPLVPCMECIDCTEGLYSLCKNYSFIGSRRQGGNAQYVAVPEHCCFTLPDGVSLLQGSFFEPVTVGMHPILMHGGCADMNVVIIGAGTIGLLTLQIAKAMGAKTVTAVDIDDAKLATATDLGADYVINSTKAEQIEQFMTNADILRNQLILEIAGVPATFKMALELAGPRSSIYLVGTMHGNFEITEADYSKILRKEAMIRGSWMNYSAPYPGPEWQQTAQLFIENKIKIDDLIDGIYQPDAYVDRLNNLKNKPGQGKILLDFTAN